MLQRPGEISIRGTVRCGNDDRDVVIARLTEMQVRGFLTQEEYDSRVECARRAVTENELASLTRDLPHEESPQDTIRKLRAELAGSRLPRPFFLAFGFVGAVFGITATALMSSPGDALIAGVAAAITGMVLVIRELTR